MTPRGGGVEVSFIFFIDIIMAVTGVMLFVIILLVLDLEQNPKLAQPVAPAVVAVEEPVPQPSAPQKKDDNSTEIADLQSRIAKRQLELERTSRTLADATEISRRLETETQELSAVANKKFKKVELALAEIGNENRKIVLIECSRDSVVLQPLGSDVRPAPCAGDTTHARQTAAIEKLKAYPKDRFAVLLLLKPSAFQGSAEFLDELRRLEYAVGAEPLEEDRTAIKW